MPPRPPRKLFTVDEANALLPLLERKLHRLQWLFRAAKDRYVEVKQLKAIGTRDDGTPIMAHDFRVARREFERHIQDINRVVAEIHRLGCQVKHIEAGLIDFPARLDGRKVLLCWRLGEPMVSHYHGQQEGFAGRRPLPDR